MLPDGHSSVKQASFPRVSEVHQPNDVLLSVPEPLFVQKLELVPAVVVPPVTLEALGISVIELHEGTCLNDMLRKPRKLVGRSNSGRLPISALSLSTSCVSLPHAV